MADLSKPFIGLNIRPLLQSCESQGPQHFHLFLELPFEIREMIWKFSLPSTRSIRVRLLVLEDRPLNLFYHRNKSLRVLDVEFSYEDHDLIMALQTSKESRQAALLVYRCLVTSGRTIYFCPNRDTLQFAGFETVFETLVSNAWRPASIMQLLMGMCNLEASRFADSSTTVEWSEPVLKRFGYITMERSLNGQAPLDEERRNRYVPSNVHPIQYTKSAT